MTVEFSNIYWRTQKERYQLVGKVCEDCKEAIFPPRDLCPECGGDKCVPHMFTGRGKLYSVTTVYEAPSGHQENAPYKLAIVELEEGPLVTAQLTDLDKRAEIKIGMPLEMVTRKLKTEGERGQIIYGYKFRPVLGKTR